MEFLILLFFYQNSVSANQIETFESEQISNNKNMPIKNNLMSQFELKKIPLTKVSSMEKKSFKERNPFLAPGNLNSNDKSINLRGLSFKGIAKVGDKGVVFIETSQGINSYEIGQTVGGGYIVSRIDDENLEVEITNESVKQIIKLEKDD